MYSLKFYMIIDEHILLSFEVGGIVPAFVTQQHGPLPVSSTEFGQVTFIVPQFPCTGIVALISYKAFVIIKWINTWKVLATVPGHMVSIQELCYFHLKWVCIAFLGGYAIVYLSLPCSAFNWHNSWLCHLIRPKSDRI